MRTVELEEAVEVLIDYRGKTPEKSNAGVLLVTAKVIKDGFVLQAENEYIAEDDYDTWMRRGLPRERDVLITTEAPLGQVARVDDPRVALAQRVILLRAKSSVIDPSYLYHLLQGPQVQGELRKRATGTTVAGIKQSELRRVPLRVPDLPTQRRVAGFLDGISRLIENNLRRVHMSEDVARLYWSRWARDARRVTAPLGDLVHLVRMQVSPAEIDSDTRYIGLEHIPRRSFDLSDHGYTRDVVSSKIPFEAGDLLFGKIRPYFHKVGPVAFDGVTSADAIVMRARSALDRLAVLMCASSDDFVAEISNKANGSKMPRARWEDMATYAVPLGTESERLALNEILEPCIALLQSLGTRNATLRKLRGFLLPKLLSGEVDVSRLPLPPPEAVDDTPPDLPSANSPRHGRRKKELA